LLWQTYRIFKIVKILKKKENIQFYLGKNLLGIFLFSFPVCPVNWKINYRHSSNSCVLSGDNEACHCCGAPHKRHSRCFTFQMTHGVAL